MELSIQELNEIYYVLGKLSLGQKNLDLVNIPLVREIQKRVGQEMVEMNIREREELNRQASKITSIGQLRDAIANFNDHDIVVVEIHEGTRSEDLYEFTIDEIGCMTLEDGTILSEVRICI
jgi:nucleoside-triphosphatase THEP1